MKEYIVNRDTAYEFEMSRFEELQELIRCKDCRNRIDVYIDNVPYKIRCKITHNVISAMDFCSFGESE